MRERIAITGYGFSAGGFGSEKEFFSRSNNEKPRLEYREFEKCCQLDHIMDRYIGYTLRKKLQLNRFVPPEKTNDKSIKTASNEAFHLCLSVKRALSKAALLRTRKVKRNEISFVNCYMYPNFKAQGVHLPIKYHWEQQSASFLSANFNITGPAYVHREGDNAGLASICLYADLIGQNRPIIAISGLSMPHPMYTRVEVFEELKPLLPHIEYSQSYVIPTKYSEFASTVIMEDYEHAKQRGAMIFAKIDDIFLSNLNIHNIDQNSLPKEIAEGMPRHANIIFGGFSRNFIIDSGEYQAIRSLFPETPLVCTRRICGRCAPASGLFAIALALKGFETDRFPEQVNRLDDISNENPLFVSSSIFHAKSAIVQEISSTGQYTGILLGA